MLTGLSDPLAFRPNPQNLLNNSTGDNDPEASGSEDSSAETTRPNDGIYHPPRLAPTPYIPPTSAKTKKSRQPPQPQALSSLLHADPSQPHVESTSGLGGLTGASQLASSRARYLKHLTEFEEEQFGRIMLGKKEEKRRKRDEGVLSIGGGLSGVGEDGYGGSKSMRAGGLADEFLDVLKESGKSSRGIGTGDGYDELRKRSKRGSVLERSRKSSRPTVDDDSGGLDKKRKRSRFEMERKNVKKRRSSN